MSTSTSSSPPAGDIRRVRALAEELRIAHARIAQLERLAEAVVTTDCWDHEIYDTPPGPGWLAVDRDGWAALLGAVSAVDRWRPWQDGAGNG